MVTLPAPPRDGRLAACAACGNAELYRKKNFPHWLGLSILTIACIVFLVAHGLFLPWLAWSVLIGTAVFDLMLYVMVGDVVVCYRCLAHHAGSVEFQHLPPFDLGTAERYRQERLRKERLQIERPPR
jgi:hypothetical protein